MSDLMKIVLMLSLSGTALAAFLALLRRGLKNRLPHGLFYYLWLLVLLRLIVPVALPVPGLELTLPEPGPIEQTVEIDPELITAIQQTQNQLPPGTTDDQWEIVTVHGAVLDNGLPMPSAPTKTEPRTPWYEPVWDFLRENFLYIWLTGAALHFLWFAVSYFRFCRGLKQDCLPLWEHEQALLDDLRGQWRVEACRSPLAQTPMLVGLIRPRIILPETAITTLQLECILRHELTHLRRRDLLYKWFTVAVTSFHWFNPLMPWLRKEISRCCELSCDEAVIGSMSDDQKRTYGETLLALAAASALPRAVPATTLCEEKKQLKERLVGILKHKHATAVILLLSCLLALLVAGCAAVLGPRMEKDTSAVPLTEEERAAVMENIRAWAEENIQAEGELTVTDAHLSDRPQRLGWLTQYAQNCWLYDLSTGKVGPVDGTYPDTARLGAVIAQGTENGKNRLWGFYLTRGEQAAAPDPISGLEQLAAAHPGATVSSMEWSLHREKGLYINLYIQDGDDCYCWEYSSICGCWGETVYEEGLDHAGTIPVERLLDLMTAVIEWQEKNAVEADRDNYTLSLNTVILPRIERSGSVGEFLRNNWENVVVYDLNTGNIARQEDLYTGTAQYGHLTLLYPATECQQWVYVVGEIKDPPPAESIPDLTGRVAVLTRNAPLDNAFVRTVDASGNTVVMDMAMALRKGDLVWVESQEGETCTVTVLAGEPPRVQGQLKAGLLSTEQADLENANQVILNNAPQWSGPNESTFAGLAVSGVANVKERRDGWYCVTLPGGDVAFWARQQDTVFAWPLPEPVSDLAGKIFVYEKEGFGSDFTIKLHADGTLGYYEGMLSSHIGMGTWAVEGDILTLHEDTFDRTFRFRVQDGALHFLREGSDQFTYIKVADGTRFLEGALPDAVYENLRLGFRMIFPGAWEGQYLIEEFEDSVRIADAWGATLCSIFPMDGAQFTAFGGADSAPVPCRVLGQDAQSVWLMYFASDVQYDPGNTAQREAYLRMYEGLQTVPFELTASGPRYFQTYDADGDGQLSAREFPRPTGEAIGLTGSEAVLYTVLSENILDLAYPAEAHFGNALVLTSVELLGSYEGEKGQIHYVCGINDSHFYDAGDDPATLAYHSMGSQGLLARVTLSAKGELEDFYPVLPGADNTQRAKEIFGPLSEQYAAWDANREIPGAYRLVPTGEELLELYKSAYFPGNQ